MSTTQQSSGEDKAGRWIMARREQGELNLANVERLHVVSPRKYLLGMVGPKGPEELWVEMKGGNLHRYVEHADNPGGAVRKHDQMADRVCEAQTERLKMLEEMAAESHEGRGGAMLTQATEYRGWLSQEVDLGVEEKGGRRAVKRHAELEHASVRETPGQGHAERDGERERLELAPGTEREEHTVRGGGTQSDAAGNEQQKLAGTLSRGSNEKDGHTEKPEKMSADDWVERYIPQTIVDNPGGVEKITLVMRSAGQEATVTMKSGEKLELCKDETANPWAPHTARHLARKLHRESGVKMRVNETWEGTLPRSAKAPVAKGNRDGTTRPSGITPRGTKVGTRIGVPSAQGRVEPEGGRQQGVTQNEGTPEHATPANPPTPGTSW